MSDPLLMASILFLWYACTIYSNPVSTLPHFGVPCVYSCHGVVLCQVLCFCQQLLLVTGVQSLVIRVEEHPQLAMLAPGATARSLICWITDLRFLQG
jgi:hypothetical protein